MFSWLKSRRATIERKLAGADSESAPTPAATLDDLEALLEAHEVVAALEASGRLGAALRSGSRYQRLEGWLSYELGNLDDARKRLEHAIELDRTNPHCHALLAATHMRQGRPDPALALAMEAESLGGRYPWLRSMLGVAHHRRGDIPQAREWFVKSLELDPARRDAMEALAAIAFDRRDWEELLDVARRLTEHYPDEARGWSYLGTAEARAGSDEAAEDCLKRALDLTASSVDSERDFASFLINCGRVREAKEHLGQALQKDPQHALLHTGHAQCQLVLDGSTEAAWREYEWRLRLPGVAPQASTGRWTGEPNPAGGLRIAGEQGLGDMLLFARFIPQVMKRCGRVVLEIPGSLVPLFRASAARFDWNGVEVTAPGEPHGGAHPTRHLPFMSLMSVLGPTLPATDVPYLLASEAREREWGRKLGPKSSRRRVALVWAGNSQREDDVLRSIPPTELAPLAGLTDVEFVSLQKDALPKYLVGVPVPLTDLTADIQDFEDSAALLRQCDLLISVDTAAAHLAGACGVPCWVLLPRAMDWRWEMGGVSQPWYPTHQTLRVDRSCNWRPLIERVARMLEDSPLRRS